jgi:glycerol-3-phosphate cytidylyltransferase
VVIGAGMRAGIYEPFTGALLGMVKDKLETWESVKFNTFFKGDDWKGTPKGKDLEDRFAAVGVNVVYFPYTAHTSSTKLRAALAALTPNAA